MTKHLRERFELKKKFSKCFIHFIRKPFTLEMNSTKIFAKLGPSSFRNILFSRRLKSKQKWKVDIYTCIFTIKIEFLKIRHFGVHLFVPLLHEECVII